MPSLILLEILTIWVLRLRAEGTWKNFFGAMNGTVALNYSNA